MSDQNSEVAKMVWAIVSLELPRLHEFGVNEQQEGDRQKQQWGKIEVEVRTILEKHSMIQTLSPGLWQIDVANNMESYLELITELRRSPYKLQILLLNSKPEWKELKPTT